MWVKIGRMNEYIELNFSGYSQDELMEMPDLLRTTLICKLIKNDELGIYHIPEVALNEEICIYAINHQKNLFNISCFPEHLKTENVYIAFVKKNPYCFNEIPFENMTENICLAAVTVREVNKSEAFRILRIL